MTIEEAEQVIDAAIQKHLAGGGRLIDGKFQRGGDCCPLGATGANGWHEAAVAVGCSMPEAFAFTNGFDMRGNLFDDPHPDYYALGKKFRAKYLDALEAK